MKIVGVTANYLGGHPARGKPKDKVRLVVDGEGVKLMDGFRQLLHEPWANITEIAVEGADEIRRRFTATRLVLFWPVGLAWKKKAKQEFFVVVDGTFGEFVLQVKAKSKYELQALLAPWSRLAGQATTDPMSWESLVARVTAKHPLTEKRMLGTRYLSHPRRKHLAFYKDGGLEIDFGTRDAIELALTIPGATLVRQFGQERVYVPASQSAEWETLIDLAVEGE